MDDPIFQYEGLVFDQAKGRIENLQHFLSISAEKLVEEHVKYTDFHAKQYKEFSPYLLDVMYDAEGDYIDVYLEGLGKYGGAFPRLLLNSIMIMGCSSFESSMRLVYKVMQHFKASELEWDRVRGNVIEKTKRILKTIDFHVEDEHEKFERFGNYFLVRNCLVHNNGEIQDFKYRDQLIPYAREKKLITEPFEESELDLNREYCDEVLSSFEFFFDDLYLCHLRKANECKG